MLGTVAQNQLKVKDAEAIELHSEYVEGAIPVILNSSVVSYMGKSLSASIYASSEKALGYL